ncbi:DNA-binding transcriptional ArsR family regulator [Streptomyces umbrinus]|uniref:DNA-binding transcriptional ArsR family regulator n=1 Tax=Streptomyces umbrinus TaxID=67370 RepID=A0ABU0SIF4_9ACTN|nr:winged helix-turn-helix domain-containing protein [Streptomyces umbrinus]MDQ1023341.1 DNA-binding transcriptional ArsR family regulator [Streptomyces umbrinus]
MLRVHFTADDIARVRVAAAPDPLWEIVNSFQALIREENALAFGEWRRIVRPRLGPADGLLAALLPPRGYFPDFLTPDLGGSLGLESAVDTVLGTPRADLRGDLARLVASPARPRPLPAEARALAEGTLEAVQRLGAALHGYHRRALAAFWPHIRAQVDADRAVRARAVLGGGTDGLLASLRPVLRWQPPVLEADYPVDHELRLDGRGLLLQPSFFCSRRPVTLAVPAPDRTPVLVYPIQHTPGWALMPGATGRDGGLGALLGRTRAAILQDVVTGRTTGELAERIGISGAAVSQHTGVLRQAGLLLSVRRSKHVLHTITPAGLVLLEGAPHTPHTPFDP